MPAAKQDRATLDDLIQAHAERLRLLSIQAARQGNDTPPHITSEIARIAAELTQLRQAAAQTISADLVEELGPVGRYQLWMAHIMRLDAQNGQLRRDVERLHARFDDLLTALATHGIRTQKAARRSKVTP